MVICIKCKHEMKYHYTQGGHRWCAACGTRCPRPPKKDPPPKSA